MSKRRSSCSSSFRLKRPAFGLGQSLFMSLGRSLGMSLGRVLSLPLFAVLTLFAGAPTEAQMFVESPAGQLFPAVETTHRCSSGRQGRHRASHSHHHQVRRRLERSSSRHRVLLLVGALLPFTTTLMCCNRTAPGSAELSWGALQLSPLLSTGITISRSLTCPQPCAKAGAMIATRPSGALVCNAHNLLAGTNLYLPMPIASGDRLE